MIAPGRYFDCADLATEQLTHRGASAQDTVILDKTCQVKAPLRRAVGSNATVRNLTLTRARVPGWQWRRHPREGRIYWWTRFAIINNQNGRTGRDRPRASYRA